MDRSGNFRPFDRHWRALWRYGVSSFFTIGIKARSMAALYALVSIALLFGQQRMYAFAELAERWRASVYSPGAAARILVCVQRAMVQHAQSLLPLKRRRAARKFEVYMRAQGKTVRFDGQGRQIDDDADDKKRWN